MWKKWRRASSSSTYKADVHRAFGSECGGRLVCSVCFIQLLKYTKCESRPRNFYVCLCVQSTICKCNNNNNNNKVLISEIYCCNNLYIVKIFSLSAPPWRGAREQCVIVDFCVNVPLPASPRHRGVCEGVLLEPKQPAGLIGLTNKLWIIRQTMQRPGYNSLNNNIHHLNGEFAM